MRLGFRCFLYFALKYIFVPRCKESKINQNQPKNFICSIQRIHCEYWVGLDILAGFDAGFDISLSFDISQHRL